MQRYKHTLRHILPTIGHVQLGKPTPQHLVRLYQKKQEEGMTLTVVFVHALLHKGLGQAVKWVLVPRNVAALLDPPKVPAKEFRPLDASEAMRLLAVAEEDRLHALYVLAVTCGLRQSELVGLRWPDAKLDKPTLTLRR